MTTPTDRPNLDRLRELDEAATDAPWAQSDTTHIPFLVDAYGEGVVQPVYDRDRDFIAAYRNATPALVAALDAVVALADKWRDRGHVPECSSTYPPCERCAKAAGAAEIRRTLSNHLDLTKGV